MGRLFNFITKDSLRKNSFALIASQAVIAGSGFIFWMLCARIFTTEEVGLATAFLSLATLVASLTNLGLSNTVMRFLPRSQDQAGLALACLCTMLTSSVIGGAVVITLLQYISPELLFIRSSNIYIVLFLALICGNTLGLLADSLTIALRKSKLVFYKALLGAIPRLGLPLVLAGMGIKGILLPHITMLIIGLLYGGYSLFMLSHKKLTPSFKELWQHRKFALGNYAGGTFGVLPTTLVPLIILHALGPEESAYFYMPMQLAVFLGVIASSTSQAMLSEAAHEESAAAMYHHVKNGLKHLYALLIPAALLLAVFGQLILAIYGQDYAQEGTVLLRLFCVSSLFVAFNWVGDTWLNIQKRNKAFLAMNGINAALVIGFCLLTSKHGLAMVGLGWLCAQTLSAVIWLCFFGRGYIRPFLSTFAYKR